MSRYLRRVRYVYGPDKPHIKDQREAWAYYSDGDVIGYVLNTRWGWAAADLDGNSVTCWHIGLPRRRMFAYLKGKLDAHQRQVAA